MGLENIRGRILRLVLFAKWYLLIYLPYKFLEWEKDIRKLILRIQMKLDPLPKSKKSEATDEWLRRIDLKHAVRYATFMYLSFYDIDYDALKEKISQIPRKIDKETIKVIAKAVTLLNVYGQECYRLVMARKEFEEKVKETRGS